VARCFQGGSNEVSLTDPQRVAVFEAALAAIEPGASTTRALLLVGLAEEVDRREWQRRHQLATDAIGIARQLDDRRALGEVMTRTLALRAGPDDVASAPMPDLRLS
jgi:hypothetical protein